MKILVTGAAGFIGAATAKALLVRGHEVVGLDSINSYYDTGLKYARLADAGIAQVAIRETGMVQSSTAPGYRFVKMDLTDRLGMDALFATEKFDAVINLAAQAGVRYSIENPYAYIESNVVGFLNILENCRRHPVRHLVYASSSSVYGMNDRVPYSESDVTDNPVSLYAATKKSNEQMAYCYSHLYGIPATGLRFFTVYGPWGRPDMAPFIFLRSILEGKPIKVFNHGEMQRDFTYIDDIVDGVVLILDHPPVGENPHKVYNIGHADPVNLMDFIRTIEKVSGHKAIMEMEEMQAGDVLRTYADTLRLRADLGYCAGTPLEVGIARFYGWYRDFYGLA
ncbi:MAG: NAD-dependent epimerase/dehydratase family protein [Bacteroidales bacterium]|nr:NAD-dependent epimerase/dehydratase family protein [Bacteroidales bacterium]